MSKDVRIKTKPGDVLFEFSDDGIHVYVGFRGGRRVPRRKVEKLHKRLTKWLARNP